MFDRRPSRDRPDAFVQLLQIQVAVTGMGLDALRRSARLSRVFLDSLRQETGLDERLDVRDILGRLPKGLLGATVETIRAAPGEVRSGSAARE